MRADYGAWDAEGDDSVIVKAQAEDFVKRVCRYTNKLQ